MDGLLIFNEQPTIYTVHLKTTVKASDTPIDPGSNTPSPLVIADNSTNPTVAIDQISAASTSNRPANQATANQQLPQTGNQNSALLGLGLSALAAMLGIGGKRLKRD